MSVTPLADALLARHAPVVRYDAQEPYFADSAAEWTDNPGNALTRADGTLLAEATPNAGVEQLSLSLLRATTYADGTAATPGDRINNPAKDYVTQARALHAEPQYRNQMYGHAATGSDGRLWLAYWFFYFYNDYNLVGDLFPAGLHEGDWEMIQLRIGSDGETPDLAVYAQHAHAEQRPWTTVERVGDRPVVYSARGSHASYFSRGVHWTGHWYDHADGHRPAPDLTLEIVHDGDPNYHWVAWPGLWGGTTPPPDDPNPLNASSPRGPGAHAQWRDPAALMAKVQMAPRPTAPRPPGPPLVTITRENENLRLRYSARVADPAALVVTLNSPQDPLPPNRFRPRVSMDHGSVIVKNAIRPDWAYDLAVSIASSDGVASRSRRLQLAPVRGSGRAR